MHKCADILEAQASVDWVSNRIIPFHQRLEAWLEAKVVIEIRDVPPPATHNPVVALEKEILPIAFTVEVGAYINTIRSGLDILAMALTKRHNLPISERNVHFPIADSEEAFFKNGGAPLLQRLSEEERAKPIALKPYRGGNAALWALHHLDIVRKHRRLLDVQIRPIHLWMEGSLKPGDFEPIHGEPFQVGAETLLGLIRKGVPALSMLVALLCSGQRTGRYPAPTVLATLAHLADAATRAIALFS